MCALPRRAPADAAYGAVGHAADCVRSGKGPRLVECQAFGRGKGRELEDADHIPLDLKPGVQNKESVARFERVLVEAGVLSSADAAAIRADEARRVLEAVHTVQAEPSPEDLD